MKIREVKFSLDELDKREIVEADLIYTSLDNGNVLVLKSRLYSIKKVLTAKQFSDLLVSMCNGEEPTFPEIDIPIATVKAWREQIGATHLVVFAIGKNGTQHVATHGKTEQNAKEAADAGNKLKTALGWPNNLCNEKPLKRICKNCFFYSPNMESCFRDASAIRRVLETDSCTLFDPDMPK